MSISITGEGIIYPDNPQGIQLSPYPTVGTVLMWAGGWGVSSCPSGWLLCDGTSYSQTTYSDLYSVIGDTYGSTATEFQVPDLVYKVPIGAKNGNNNIDKTTAYAVDTQLTGGTDKINSIYFRHDHKLQNYNLVWDNKTDGANFKVDAGQDMNHQANVNSNVLSVTSSNQTDVNGTAISSTQENYYAPYTVVRYIICSGVI